VFEERNAIHTALMEKAAQDRHLLQSQGPRATFDLKQPEYVYMAPCVPLKARANLWISAFYRVSFNTAPPYNVPAGSSADLGAVVAHYEQQNKQMEEARLARMKDGKVVSLYD
jgi:hypothetical protein